MSKCESKCESKCPHIRQMRQSGHDYLLSPKNWSCLDCGTTESVWGCLICNHFGCGESSSGHSLLHYNQHKHPVAIEVNRRCVYCYECNGLVASDTLTCEVELVQSLLEQVASQRYRESRTRSGRVLRPAMKFLRMESRIEVIQSHKADKLCTADCHRKYSLLSKAFNTWKKITKSKDEALLASSSRGSYYTSSHIHPGVTGLRNLGNTCYINAALQSLGHLHFMRETFRQMGHDSMTNETSSSVLFDRQTTVECFQHISTKPNIIDESGRKRSLSRGTAISDGGGLAGGKGGKGRLTNSIKNDNEDVTSLCEEIHRLMRVMWSGKWSVVTPHTVLTSIWRHIPSFRGYIQHDAQEFLCELLDRLHSELLQYPSGFNITISVPWRDVVPARDLIQVLFEGQLTSTVSYTNCGHNSIVTEPFWDLSLEFPYNCGGGKRSSSYTLTGMLSSFTKVESVLDANCKCSLCNELSESLTKQLLISHPPEVLRLHLKRFRYTGTSWQKINNHVIFPLELNIYEYCKHNTSSTQLNTARSVVPQVVVINSHEDFQYDLTSMIVHHGTGFTSGHYTAYCWNNEAGSWIHSNDARMSRCTTIDVLKAQSYILFYARRTGRSPIINNHYNDTCDITPPLNF